MFSPYNIYNMKYFLIWCNNDALWLFLEFVNFIKCARQVCSNSKSYNFSTFLRIVISWEYHVIKDFMWYFVLFLFLFILFYTPLFVPLGEIQLLASITMILLCVLSYVIRLSY